MGALEVKLLTVVVEWVKSKIAFETEQTNTPTDDVFVYSEAEHAKSIIMVQGAHLIPWQ
jgi:hypothetical protein